MLSLEALFCHCEPQWQKCLLGEGLQHRSCSRSLRLSKIMTILSAFHQSIGVSPLQVRQLLGQFSLWIDCLLPPTQETILHT